MEVFVSYSQGDPIHEDLVRRFAASLGTMGVTAHLDKWKDADEVREGRPSEPWHEWINRMVAHCQWVIVVCDPSYKAKLDRKVPDDAGKGVKFEGQYLLQHIYSQGGRSTNFVPVLFSKDNASCIPDVLGGFSYFVVDKEEGVEKLMRRLTNAPEYERAPVAAALWKAAPPKQSLPLAPIPHAPGPSQQQQYPPHHASAAGISQVSYGNQSPNISGTGAVNLTFN